MPTTCSTVTFTQTFEGPEASSVAGAALNVLRETYEGDIGCRVPFCYLSLNLPTARRSTMVTLHQTIIGDSASFDPQRQRSMLETYNVLTDCRPPFCIGTLSIAAGSINVRVVLDIPDTPTSSLPSSNALSTAAAVKTAASALAAQPLSALSTMIDETVVSTSSPVVSRVRRIDARLVLAIPDANADATALVASINASVIALAAAPAAVESVMNATVVSTTPIAVMYGVVVPLVVSTWVPPASQSRATPIAIVVLLGLLFVALIAIVCAYLVRVGQQDGARKELLMEAKSRRHEREQGETELANKIELAGAPPEATGPEHQQHVLAEHAKERVRAERMQEALEASRKERASSYMEAHEDV